MTAESVNYQKYIFYLREILHYEKIFYKNNKKETKKYYKHLFSYIFKIIQ